MRRDAACGLMAFWADIDADYVDEFRRWHNCEHVAERVAIAGFRVGRRYCGLGGAPTFFMFYETDDTSVLKSDAYLAALDAPTPWTRRSLAHFRNPVRTIYGLVAGAGAPATLEAPFLWTLRFDLAAEDAPAWCEWYAGTVLPALTAMDGVHRARLYENDEAVSGIMTSERGIYRGGPGRQRYLAFVELAAPDLPDGAPWRAAHGRGGADGLAACRDPAVERFWLDFVLYPPGVR
jgi:hypothetical protein